MITLDYCNNDSLWKIKFSNAVSDPFVVLVKADADKMYILLLSVFTDSLQARVLIDKSGGNNTGGDATIPTPRNAINIPKILPMVVTG